MLRIKRLAFLLIAMTTLAGCNISGRITNPDGTGRAGVTVTLSGAANQTTTTNAAGQYRFAVPSTGNFTITPSLAGFTFAPPSRAVTKSSPWINVTGNDFVTSPTSPGTLIYEHSQVYLGVDMALSVYENATHYTFELWRNGTASEGTNAGCSVSNATHSVSIAKDTVLSLDPGSSEDDLLYPIYTNPSGEVTEVTIRRYDSDSLQFVVWLHPDIGCPSTDLHFEITPNSGVVDGETLEEFFERFKAYAAGPIYQHSQVYIGVDMTLSVYEGATQYYFELFRDGTSTGGGTTGCVAEGETQAVSIAKNTLVTLDPASPPDDLLYPIYADPSGDITEVTIREYDATDLQFVVWLHPDIGCPSTDLHFEITPNSGVVDGETLENFFSRF